MQGNGAEKKVQISQISSDGGQPLRNQALSCSLAGD